MKFKEYLESSDSIRFTRVKKGDEYSLYKSFDESENDRMHSLLWETDNVFLTELIGQDNRKYSSEISVLYKNLHFVLYMSLGVFRIGGGGSFSSFKVLRDYFNIKQFISDLERKYKNG